MSSLVESQQWITPAPPAAPVPPVPLAAAGRGQGSPGGAFGLDGWLRLAGEAVRLPWRIFGLSLQLLGRTGEQSRRAVGGGVADAVSRGYDPDAPVAVPSPWALRTPLTPVPVNPSLPQNAAQSPPAPGPQIASGAGAGGAATHIAGTPNRKETPMSCSVCETTVGSAELKIIQYSIVNVDPYIEDCDFDDDEKDSGAAGRVIYSGTLSTTQDLTDADLTAWVIAMYFQRPDHKRMRHCEKQYLRVCSFVECRVPMPKPNYQQRQVEVLEQISRKLPDSRRDERGGLPAKER